MTRLKLYRCESASRKRTGEFNELFVELGSSPDLPFSHFTLAMQAGAFVQLIILFAAISSRMFVLSSELEEALQLSVLTCNRLLVIIHVNMSSAHK